MFFIFYIVQNVTPKCYTKVINRTKHFGLKAEPKHGPRWNSSMIHIHNMLLSSTENQGAICEMKMTHWLTANAHLAQSEPLIKFVDPATYDLSKRFPH